MSGKQHLHILRLLLSCRKITAQVNPPGSSTIVAMASSSEQEFLSQYRAKLDCFLRHRQWNAKVSARVGEKLAIRLKEIGVNAVTIDINEEIYRPIRQRKMVSPLFDSVLRVGIEIEGAEKLRVM